MQILNKSTHPQLLSSSMKVSGRFIYSVKNWLWQWKSHIQKNRVIPYTHKCWANVSFLVTSFYCRSMYIHLAIELISIIKSPLMSNKMLWQPQLFLDGSESSFFLWSRCVHGVGWIYESISLYDGNVLSLLIFFLLLTSGQSFEQAGHIQIHQDINQHATINCYLPFC